MDETASELETDPSSSSVSPSASQICEWIREQDLLKQRLVTEDNFPWKPPSSERLKAAEEVEGDALVHVGGLDISFCKEDPSVGCATLVVLDLRTLSVVLEESAVVRLKVPAGKSIASVIVNDLNGAVPLRTPLFLVPERPTAPVLLSLLETVKKKKKDAFPQLIMVDGNGILHPQGFGLACHLGVLADLPSIGIGKNLHFVDGLSMSGVKQLLRSRENFSKDAISLIGSSGRTWGVALRPTRDALKPIFVSVGHRISLDTAVRIVRSTCKYRNPEPVRQADIQSRAFLRRKGFVC